MKSTSDGQVIIADDRANQDVTGVCYHSAIMVGCDFEGTTFGDANMTRSKWIDCDFKGADFRGTDLTGVIFLDCNLTDAIFDAAGENAVIVYGTIA